MNRKNTKQKTILIQTTAKGHTNSQQKMYITAKQQQTKQTSSDEAYGSTIDRTLDGTETN